MFVCVMYWEEILCKFDVMILSDSAKIALGIRVNS